MEFPSYNDLFNAFKAKFQESQPDIDPSVKGNWAGSFGRGIAGIGYSIVILLKEVTKQFNPLTATGLFLELWAAFEKIVRLGASSSIGQLRVYGVSTTIVPSGEQWTDEISGTIFTNGSSSEIQPQDSDAPPTTIEQIIRSGSTATVLTFFPHNYRNGEWVRIYGSDQSEYNGIFQISVNTGSPYQFEYTVSGTPVTPATGSIISSVPIVANDSIVVDPSGDFFTVTTLFPNELIVDQYVKISGTDVSDYNNTWVISEIVDNTTFVITSNFPSTPSNPSNAGIVQSIHAIVNVQSTTTGESTAVGPNSLLKYLGSVTDVFDVAKTIEGLQGGASLESDDRLRSRMLQSRSGQAGVFTNDQIELAAKLINGNTRIYIQNPRADQLSDVNAVLPGQVRIYVLRDNDPLGPVPIGSILQLTKESIVNNGKLTASMWETDVFVDPPILRPVDIVIDNVVPNTASMRTYLKNQLNAYFKDTSLFGQDLDEDILRAVIVNTQDLDAGDVANSYIKSFDLTNVSLTNTINSVESSGTGSRFLYSNGPIPNTGDSITISGFISNPTYNGTFTVGNVGAGYFETPTTFSTSESTGSYELDTLDILNNEIPVLGNLTINGVSV